MHSLRVLKSVSTNMPMTFRAGLFLLLLAVANHACSETGSACPPVVAQPTHGMIQAGMKNARSICVIRHLAERVDALHAGGKQVFAAVGSLHMFGKSGCPR